MAQHNDEERTQKHMVEQYALLCNQPAAGLALADDEVRDGFRRLFSAVRSILAGGRSEADRRAASQPKPSEVRRTLAATPSHPE